MNRQARRHPFISLVEGDGSGGSGGAPPAPPVSFTPDQQASIDLIVQGRVAQAQRAAAATKEAEIKAWLDSQKAEADKDKLDEVDRLKAEKAEAEAKAAQAEAQVAAVTARASATTALVAAGVQAAVIDDALRLIDTDADDIAGEVTALATRLPALFTPATDGTPPPPAPHLRPATPPTGTGGGSNPKEQAAAMRAAVFPTRKPAA